MPRVLLTTLNAKYIHTNLAVRILYQLNKHHTGLSWREYTIKGDFQKIASDCASFDVVAFSCYIWNIRQTLEVCTLIKKQSPQTRILLGGPEVSYEYEEVIRRDEIDYIIVGEGETAFTEFLQAYPSVDSVPNLVYKREGVVAVNPSAPLFDVKKLASIMPYAGDSPQGLAGKVLYIETSRGCPYKCEFCLASLDNKVRYLPDEYIKSTLLYLMQNGQVIKFLDRTFNIKKDFSIDVFSFILQHHRPGNVFQFEITADIVHPEIVRFIQEKVPAGLFRFEIGIQTVNQAANLAVSRKQNFEKTKAIIRQLEENVEMHLDLIVGLPYEKMKDIKHSFEEVFALHPPELQLGFLKFLKGTPVRDKHNEHGYVFEKEAPYQIIESRYLSKEELHRITEVEHALEIYWNGKKAVHSLTYVSQRYSIFDFLEQLGKWSLARFKGKQYTTEALYEQLALVAWNNYRNDKILHQLIVADHYLHHNRIPGALFLSPAVNKKKRHIRYAEIPMSFDLPLFLKEKVIREKEMTMRFVYDGIGKCRVEEANEAVTV